MRHILLLFSWRGWESGKHQAGFGPALPGTKRYIICRMNDAEETHRGQGQLLQMSPAPAETTGEPRVVPADERSRQLEGQKEEEQAAIPGSKPPDAGDSSQPEKPPSLVDRILPWKVNVSVVTRVLTAVIVLAVIGYGYVHAGRNGFANAENSLKNSEKQLNLTYDQYAAKDAKPALLIPGSLPEATKNRLYAQALLSLALARDYLYTVKQFYRFYYACLFMAFVTGCLAAIILVLTTRDGWKNADDHLIIVFAVVSVATVAFGVAPNVFKYEANLEANKVLYANCANIQAEIVTYALTYQAGKTQKGAEAFLHEIDQKLSDARKVPLGFDPSKLPTPIQMTKDITGR